MIAAGKLAHQPVGEVVEIVQSFTQKWIGLPQHSRARVGLHAFYRGFSGEPGQHSFFQLVRPAAVVGEHPIGFEHVAMLAALDE